MKSDPVLVSQKNISVAWADAFLRLSDARGRHIGPLTVSFGGFERGIIIEDPSIRAALDTALAAAGMSSTQTVANTIFPQSLWALAKGDRHKLYSLYRENLPAYTAMEPSRNGRGLYFGRLIAYDLDHKTGNRHGDRRTGLVRNDGNQLEFIITQCRPKKRVSMLQASVFDPARDHSTAAQLAFPCLQHLTIVPDYQSGTIALNAFYATQQLFAKGYGNFLGLARLGLFIAGETQLRLDRVSCFVGVEKMEKKPAKDHSAGALLAACRTAVPVSVRP